MNELPDWTTDEYLGNIAASELDLAMTSLGIVTLHVGADEDGDVWISFAEIDDATTLVTLGLEAGELGSVYDRATGSCLSMSDLGENATEEAFTQARIVGWKWVVHPHLSVRRVAWHVRVCIPSADANQLTANLNALRNGGAL